MRRRILDAILACGVAFAFLWGSLAASLVMAEVLGLPSISSTSTSATVTLARSASSIVLINDTDSTDEAYLRLFHCGNTTAAATTSSPIRLEPGESEAYTYTWGEGGTGGYCAFSHVTATGETATLRYRAK